MASFDISVRTRAGLHPGGEPTAFVSEYDGVITCTDDETGEVTRVGKAHALRVHAGLAENAGEPLFDVCDAHSGELRHLHALLYEPDGYAFRGGITQRFDAVETDLLVLDFVVLNPRWRRLKLGLLSVRKLVDLIGGGCGLAVSLIAPLRHSAAELLRVPPSWLPQQTSEEERRQAAVKLRRYFRRMGFRRLGRTPYYALSMSQVTPGAPELLGGMPPGGG
jgi:hypothetical protein